MNTKIKISKLLNLRLKINIILIFVVLLALLLGLWFTYKVSYDDTIETYREKTEQVVNALLPYIDVNFMKKYQQTLTMDEHYYEKTRQIDECVVKIGAKRIFICAPFDENYCIYIYRTEENGHIDSTEEAHTVGRKLLGDKFEKDSLAEQVLSGTENYNKSEIAYDGGKWGYVCSGYSSIKDESNKVIGFMGVDYDLNEEIAELNDFFLKIAVFITLVVFLTSLSIYFVFNKYMIVPVQKMTYAASHILNSKRTKINEYKIKILNKNDDIAVLASAFNKMISDLQTYTENIKKINAEKEQISTELNIATQIQTSLIPHTFPAFPELDEIDIYANSKPAKKVGGDFYDFFLLDNEHLAFVIADVSGKGISAALFMVIARTLIRNETSVDKTPGEILHNVNEQMCSNNDLGMFITLFLGILNFKTGELQFSNAGHLKPIYKFRNNKFKELKVKKNFVIAGMPNLNFKDEKIQMNQNDVIFMYTDGIVETLDKNNSQSVGVSGLLNLLNSIDLSKCSLKYIVELVRKDIEKISNGEQFDDETILIIKFKGPQA